MSNGGYITEKNIEDFIDKFLSNKVFENLRERNTLKNVLILKFKEWYQKPNTIKDFFAKKGNGNYELNKLLLQNFGISEEHINIYTVYFFNYINNLYYFKGVEEIYPVITDFYNDFFKKIEFSKIIIVLENNNEKIFYKQSLKYKNSFERIGKNIEVQGTNGNLSIVHVDDFDVELYPYYTNIVTFSKLDMRVKYYGDYSPRLIAILHSLKTLGEDELQFYFMNSLYKFSFLELIILTNYIKIKYINSEYNSDSRLYDMNDVDIERKYLGIDSVKLKKLVETYFGMSDKNQNSGFDRDGEYLSFKRDEKMLLDSVYNSQPHYISEMEYYDLVLSKYSNIIHFLDNNIDSGIAMNIIVTIRKELKNFINSRTEDYNKQISVLRNGRSMIDDSDVKNLEIEIENVRMLEYIFDIYQFGDLLNYNDGKKRVLGFRSRCFFPAHSTIIDFYDIEIGYGGKHTDVLVKDNPFFIKENIENLRDVLNEKSETTLVVNYTNFIDLRDNRSLILET
jgi:hypothetical protein